MNIKKKLLEAFSNETIGEIAKKNREILWAITFHDTVDKCEWYNVKSLSPGRWAVGYPFLYVQARVLDGVRPTKILEMGLGQSSKMFMSYVDFFGGEYDIIEQNQEWINFFMRNEKIPAGVNIHVSDIFTPNGYNEGEFFKYIDFANITKGKKYNVISVDGPWGGSKHSREDIIDSLPEILEESFVILFDDTERKAEQNTIKIIENKLSESNIDFCSASFGGEKNMTIICSKKYEFLTTI